MSLDIDVSRNLEEIGRRMKRFPREYEREMDELLSFGLTTLHENVPSYPDQIPGTDYIRTGQLGRSFGVSQSGGKFGRPDIYEKEMGPTVDKAVFGSNLGYAPRVVGSNQEQLFRTRGWWTVKTILDRAKNKIITRARKTADNLARFLEGRGF